MTSNVARVIVLGCATALAAATPLSAVAQQDDPGTRTIAADVDGDGTLDRVTVRQLDDSTQTLTFEVAGRTVEVTTEGEGFAPLEQPRRVDVNSDGRDEVVLARAVGANTVTFDLWSYDPVRAKIFPVSTPDGARLDVFEGGGVNATSGYTCVDHPDTGARDFVTVNAYRTEAGTFDGERTTYSVDGDLARQTDRVEFTAVDEDDPVLATEPSSCGTV
ncbi:hypothetical protein [Prauserella cavernicola]|uniref:VCBS repeat-containing protein n=1 Tax=Prauserella cavernicola TaxID=2800127 RepID=A0A934V3V1_9PSEU|nr:hypothetical protein [Prauserella cavernicola]MBK1787691.1 hypothetical protein [Prauserella cavernicola]